MPESPSKITTLGVPQNIIRQYPVFIAYWLLGLQNLSQKILIIKS